MTLSRRKLLTGLTGIIAAPAIVHYASIMPVKTMPKEISFDLTGRAWSTFQGWKLFDQHGNYVIITDRDTLLIKHAVDYLGTEKYTIAPYTTQIPLSDLDYP